MQGKKIIRNSVARALFMMGLTAPGWRGHGRLSIATFHRVLPDSQRQAYPFPGLAVTPQELDTFLAYFTQHFDCGTVAAQHERYLSGENPARPLLAITFDDAQHDNYLNARPVLAKHHIKASFFVPVVAVQRRELLWHDRLGFAILAVLQSPHGHRQLMQLLDNAGLSANGPYNMLSNIVNASKMLTLEARLSFVETLAQASNNAPAPDFARLMTFEELAQLARDGHEIGSHSMTHCLMTECDDQTLAYEVDKSREVLESHLGQPVETFCYPNGNSDAHTAHAVGLAGYHRAVTTTWGSNGPKADPLQLRRYDMNASRAHSTPGKFSPALLAFRMSGFYPGLG